MKLNEIQEEYEKVLHSESISNREKAIRFANLMTIMESAYQIPMMKNAEWEKENKVVIAMYRKLSRSRSIDD